METVAIEILNRIMSKFADTGSMRTAYDSVMGDGAFDKLAGDVYDTINARGAA